MNPLLLLDVDGVLSPDGSRDWLDHSMFRRHKVSVRDDGLRVDVTLWLTRYHGRRLSEIAEVTGARLVWCTSWNEHANEHIARRVGLPKLSYVFVPPGADKRPEWKYDAVTRYAGEAPIAWLDDEFDKHPAVNFLAQRQGLPTLLHTVNASTGLLPQDLDAIRSWLDDLKSSTQALRQGH
jgi:HAD domain in Swiss Army Knife RNA repair proteins